MQISILTLFPQMFEGPFNHSIIKRAQDAGLVSIRFVNIRDFGIGKHKIVDDKPYGGGTGMVLRVDVIDKAIRQAKKSYKGPVKKQKIILLDARGKQFTQERGIEYAKAQHLILIAGHYEGFDERIREYLVDESISIGDYILTGGEIPAMVLTDALVRLAPKVLKKEATQFESFSHQAFSENSQLLEHAHYTKPAVYKNQKVPEILLSGDHSKIETWRKENALSHTKKHRPDLLK